MGRYYSGDIEGKFMFGVQDSNAADRFGSYGYEPRYLKYSFNKEDHLEEVQKELQIIEKTLGEYLKKIEDYFETNGIWRDEDMANAFGITTEQLRFYISEYADYKLGIKIKDCLLAQGSCEFDAEF